MNWPITLSADKCAIVIMSNVVLKSKRRALLRSRGWMDPETGPWTWCDYWWRWGATPVTDVYMIHVYDLKRYLPI